MLYTKSTLLVIATSDHFSAVNLKAPLKIQEGVLAVTPQKKKKKKINHNNNKKSKDFLKQNPITI